MLEKLIQYIESELEVSPDEIALARKSQILEPYILPMVLWQYGVLDLEELDRIFDWLETI